MSTSMVSLGIATGFERGYGVPVRLGATPLGRGRLLAAKIASVIVIELVQALLIVGLGLALGWKPSGGVSGAVQAVLACLLASLAFGGIGLAMAGRLREARPRGGQRPLPALAAARRHGRAAEHSARTTAAVAELLPAAALSASLHGAIGPIGGYGGCWVVLGAWAVAMPLLAIAVFSFRGD
jgi:ABC-2 type transport system permease protein